MLVRRPYLGTLIDAVQTALHKARSAHSPNCPSGMQAAADSPGPAGSDGIPRSVADPRASGRLGRMIGAQP